MKQGLLILVGWRKWASAKDVLEPACTGSHEEYWEQAGIVLLAWSRSWWERLQKSADATNQGSSLPSSWLLNISLFTNGFSYLKIWYIPLPWIYYFPPAVFFPHVHTSLQCFEFSDRNCQKKKKKGYNRDVCPWTKIEFYIMLAEALIVRKCCS